MLYKQDAREGELGTGSGRSRYVTVLGQSPFQPRAAVRKVAPQVPEKVKISGQCQERRNIMRLALPRQRRSEVRILGLQAIEDLLRIWEVGSHPGVERLDQIEKVDGMPITRVGFFTARSQLL